MSEQYLRKCVVDVDSLEITDLRMAFKVEKTLKAHANQAELRIWNLSPDSRAKLIKDLTVSIVAGYQQDINQIFSGTMRKVDHPKIGPDFITTARIGDGEKEIKSARIRTSRKGKFTPADLMKTLIKETGLKSGNAIKKAEQGDLDGAWKDITSGLVLSGNTYDKLEEAARNAGYDVSVQDGALLLLGEDETTQETSIEVSSATGLIGSPQQAEGGFIRAVSLLNGQLTPGRQVELKSRQFNGACRIDKVVFVGDTHGQEWFADLELKRLGSS